MYGTINRGGSPRRLGSPLAGRIAGAALTLCSLSTAGTALAGEPTAAPAPAGTRLTGTLGLASQYVTKGVGKSNDEPSASGSIELSRNGFDITGYQSDLSGQGGPVSTRFHINYTADELVSTKEAWWVEFQGGIALDENAKATAAVGDRAAEYTAWNVGAKRKLPHDLALDVRWYDTDGHGYGARSIFRGSKNEDLV